MGGNRNSEGKGEGPKGSFPRGRGVTHVGFFQGALSKIGELLINNSFSDEQVISYFTVTSVSKQVFLFALIIFYLQSANYFFHGLCHSLCLCPPKCMPFALFNHFSLYLSLSLLCYQTKL